MSGSGSNIGPALNARSVTIPIHAGTPFDYNWAVYPPKDPEDVLQFRINANNFLTDAGTTFAGTPSIIPNSPDLTVSGITVVGNAVMFTVAGGVVAARYALVMTAALANGDVLSRTVFLPVIPQYTVGYPPQTVIATGAPGRGIAVITQPDDEPGSLLVTYTDGTSQLIALPGGDAALSVASVEALSTADQAEIINLLLSSLPTTSAGLADGAWWNDGGSIVQFEGVVTPPSNAGSYVVQEDGVSRIALEDGTGFILLEAAASSSNTTTTAQNALLLESGTPLLLENDTPLLLEA